MSDKIVGDLLLRKDGFKDEIKNLEEQIKQRKADIVQIDKTILIFDNNYTDTQKKPRRKWHFAKGELNILICKILKEHKELTAKKLISIIQEKKETTQDLSLSVRNTLSRLKDQEVLECSRNPASENTRELLYRIADIPE